MSNSNSLSNNFWDSLDLDKMSYDELKDLSRKVSPFYKKRSKKEDKEWFNFSILNLREKYMERLMITTVIGYMFRCADEYTAGSKEEARKFCEHIFRFDPNRHLESAKSDVIELQDEEVDEISKDMAFEDVQQGAQTVHRCADIIKMETSGTLRYLDSAIKEVREGKKQALFDKAEDRIIKTREVVNDTLKTLTKLSRPKTSMMALSDKAVPGEIFHGFDRYYQANYEELRKITETVYPERSDLEFAIQFYKSFRSEDDAREYAHVNQDDFDYDIITATNDGITVLGPFKKNKASLDYYNKNSDIIDKIMKQNLSDQKMGNELMRSRVHKDKSKDIEKHGAEPKKLAEWKKVKGEVDNLMNNKNPSAMTDDEKKKLAEAREKLELLETADDENVIPVHRQSKDGSMQTKYVKTDVSDATTYAHVN